ncbi:hypothetical protein SCP_0400090 [Sparassis crispa]|uniref:Uncharacterized protein n=1 Tax=Sparassis crispa TaxID=139825 RepID=A0A401GHK9_9APHY|nr:hypothetical protein SCP_0400090 [Sparassis crispa]GBE81638.1 hypothetical protein SCP_0400090 [Sparassis crispa]
MDMNVHHHDPNNIPPTASSSRKRSRENETPSQRHKREKAAERQRRKRERDRQAGLNNILALSQVQAGAPQVEQPIPDPQSISDVYKGDEFSMEELAKRDRVRAAARERQRKHRALVKARKLRELGLDMGNEILPGMEEVQYRMNADGQYQPVMPHEMPPHQPPHTHPMHEPPFPQGQPLGGQTFASTLLLSFSCAPLLKQHLLRTLNMTNEELASLEPIIAQAWDHWDQQRRMHAFAHHPGNAQKAPDGSAMHDPNAPYQMNDHGVTHPYVHDPSQAPPNDFRARFHRPLVAPSPFRSAIVDPDAQQQQQPGTAPSSSASVSASVGPPGPSAESLDPHLSAGSAQSDQRNGVVGIDPQLGQARDEAAGVAGKLER